MGLPTITVPKYSLKLPSSGKEIKYRPFLVKEEKILLIAMESEDEKQIIDATTTVINNCIFGDIDVDTMPLFDIEYIFLWLRAKAKGELVELKYTCPDCQNTIDLKFNVEDVKIKTVIKEANKIELTDHVKETEDTNQQLNEIIKSPTKIKVKKNKKAINTDIAKPKKQPTQVKKERIGIISYLLVGIITLIAMVILIDTFKLQLSRLIPNIDFYLVSLYETLNDIVLFFKDLLK